jgi:haloacetate dehalogenase
MIRGHGRSELGAVTFDDFSSDQIETADTSIFVRWSGSGPPILLLHGFPQTHLMWREIAPALAADFTLVCADLRGYGRSGCPVSDAAHYPYSKRVMAGDMVSVMRRLGHERFGVAGHDRGGRVAYRLALDHPGAVDKVAVLDVLPTSTMWELADARLALAFWPWSLLAQPAPLPERLLGADPAAVVDNALCEWGSSAGAFDGARDAYVAALEDATHTHAICEEYRAAATVDRAHDADDRAAGKRITAPLLALWSAGGGLQDWYAAIGGPLALWREWADDVSGRAVAGGHFFPEESPEETASELGSFFAR